MRENELVLIVGGAMLGVATVGAAISAFAFWEINLASSSSWWNNSELATWGQTIGSLLAVVVAIGVPMALRRIEKNDDAILRWNDSNLVVVLNTARLVSNREFLRIARIAIARVENECVAVEMYEDNLIEALYSLVPVDANDIKYISGANLKLALLLADQRGKIELLHGVMKRNIDVPIRGSYLLDTFKSYIADLQSIDDKIINETII